MNIEFENIDKRGSFFIEENGDRLAELAFRWVEDGNMAIDHTDVDERLAGKEIGKQLVRRAVEMAREDKFKIIPYCPFAKAVIEKTKEFQDVLL